MSNAIQTAAKQAARTAKIAKSYGLKKAKDAKAAARTKAITAFYKGKARENAIAEWVAKKVKASYQGKRSVRTPASAEAVAG